MDPITHSLTGAALSRAGLHRTTPLATLTLVVAANAPDIDVLSMLRGSYAALAFRRGVTHGPLAMLLLPVLVAAVVLLYDRLWRRRRRHDAPPAQPAAVLALAAIGCLTHSPLDWMNTYGIRMLEPFAARWFYGDALFIIDPWIWLVLAAVVAGATVSRRGWIAWSTLAAGAGVLMIVAPQVPAAARAAWFGGLAITALLLYRARLHGGAAGTEPRDERRARIALAAALLYIAGMVGSGAAARGVVAGVAAERGIVVAGLDADDLMVGPVPANPFRSDVVVRTDDAYHLGEFRWLASPRVRWTQSIPTGPRDDVVLATLQLPQVRDFLRWSRFPWVAVFDDDAGLAVRWGDARYPDLTGRGGLGGVLIRVDRPQPVDPPEQQPSAR